MALALGGVTKGSSFAHAPGSGPGGGDINEDDVDSPVDFGSGPVSTSGVLADTLRRVVTDGEVEAVVTKPGAATSAAYTAGHFGAPFGWPLIPIHLVLLPDGRVLSYGSDDQGRQGAQFQYAVWDPGWNPKAPDADISPFQVLPNRTGTDLFCSAQLVLPNSGQVLLVGGDRIVNGRRNYATADVNIYDPADDSIRRESTPMGFRRWYPTTVTTERGDVVVLGGRDDVYFRGNEATPGTIATHAATPEMYVPGKGWRTLGAAHSDAAFGAVNGNNWWYPKAWLMPDGKILTITHEGHFYTLDTKGEGRLTLLKTKVGRANWNMPSTMFAPGKILSLRNRKAAVVIDMNGPAPKATNTAPMSTLRKWGFATVLADGTVWVNGGSTEANTLDDAVYTSETWHPATGRWTVSATAHKARMYHSASLLLPSGAVLTGGGGAPGPVRNLNAELYFPPYLFNPDGSEAARPVIQQVAPKSFSWSSRFQVTMGAATPVSRVTLVRTGSATHSFNNEQRFTELPFVQRGSTLEVTAPPSATDMPPGYYMLFVFQANPAAPAQDQRLVPSVAQIVKLS